jgi:hypothetical protein
MKLQKVLVQIVFAVLLVGLVGLAIVNSYRAYRDVPVVYAQVLSWPEPPYSPKNVSFSTSGNQTLVAAPAVAGLCVYGLVLTNAGASATTILIYQDGGTTAVASTYLSAGGGSASWTLQPNNPKNPYFLTNTATAFVINSSAAVQVNGSVYAANCP